MPIFEDYAVEYSFWIERVNPPHYQRMLGDFLPERIDQALDAGCGPGFLSIYLAQKAETVVGLDISPSMLRVAERKKTEQEAANISLLLADLHDPPFPAQSFDFIGSDSVLHDTIIETTLPSLIKLLKPGGRLAVRDLVTRQPRKARLPIWQVLRTIKNTPRYWRRVGINETIRLLSFELNPTWVRHKCEGPNMTPQAFRNIYERFLPGCRFLDYGWAMAALWESPA